LLLGRRRGPPGSSEEKRGKDGDYFHFRSPTSERGTRCGGCEQYAEIFPRLKMRNALLDCELH
jgi:hypothetical protein